MTRKQDSSVGHVKRVARRFAGLRNAKRRVSGPLDTSTFAPPVLPWAPSPHSGELARLSLYRLGLSGTYGKYRVVPRSAIVAHDRLEAAVRNDRGEGTLRSVIERLWRDHGAPSHRVIDKFLSEADRHDRLREADPTEDVEIARGRILEEWLGACHPPSNADRLRQNVELAVCFVLRRMKQYARALVHKMSA